MASQRLGNSRGMPGWGRIIVSLLYRQDLHWYWFIKLPSLSTQVFSSVLPPLFRCRKKEHSKSYSGAYTINSFWTNIYWNKSFHVSLKGSFTKRNWKIMIKTNFKNQIKNMFLYLVTPLRLSIVSSRRPRSKPKSFSWKALIGVLNLDTDSSVVTKLCWHLNV